MKSTVKTQQPFVLKQNCLTFLEIHLFTLNEKINSPAYVRKVKQVSSSVHKDWKLRKQIVTVGFVGF